MAEKQLKFEEALVRLEQVVSDLENGKVALDEALSLYEEGMKLVKSCSKRLDEAEQRVSLIQTGTDGDVSTVPFAKEAEQ